MQVDTDLGQFEFELLSKRAPKTCAYFRKLIEAGKLNGSSVFRIVSPQNLPLEDPPIHIVQMGLGLDSARTRLSHESTHRSGLSHRQWTVSAARFGAGELYGSFFVCMRDEPSLDLGGDRASDGLGFAAFGRVRSGFDCLKNIFSYGSEQEMINPQISVLSICLLDRTTAVGHKK